MIRPLFLLLAALLCTGCVFHTRCENLNGLTNNDGEEIVYQETSIIALHTIFGVWSMIEDASLTNTVDQFTLQATEAGDTNVRITQSGGTNFWWVLPPLSFIVTPVTSYVAGDVR